MDISYFCLISEVLHLSFNFKEKCVTFFFFFYLSMAKTNFLENLTGVTRNGLNLFYQVPSGSTHRCAMMDITANSAIAQSPNPKPLLEPPIFCELIITLHCCLRFATVRATDFLVNLLIVVVIVALEQFIYIN